MYGFRKSKGTQDALVRITDRIMELKASGKTVAILALDASAAFDCLNHNVILTSLKIMGVGQRMIHWSESFLTSCSKFVDIDGIHLDYWTLAVGVGQGRKLSPDYYNVGSTSAASWSKISESFLFADDGANVIAGDSISDCNQKIQEVANELALWFDLVGLTLNPQKSEVIGFGFDPEPITIKGHLVQPKKSIKFLGLHIQSDLKWDQQVELICNKLRSSAGRIRVEGYHFTIKDRRQLYFAWTQGCLMSNALVLLPRLNSIELFTLQTAANAAIRAVLGLPRFGKVPINDLRMQLKIPSVRNICDRVLNEYAWKRNSHAVANKVIVRNTRSTASGKIIHPIQKSLRGHMISTKADLAWNSLPIETKFELQQSRAFALIKKSVYAF